MIVDQVSQIKMVFNQFENSSIIMICLRILIVLSQKRMLVLNTKEQQSNQNSMLSDTYNSKINQYKSFGWILRFLETRDSRVRVMTWDLLTLLFDYELFKAHPSIIFQVINSFLKNQELYSVKISALKFMNKVCDALMKNCEDIDYQDDVMDSTDESQNTEKQLTVKNLLQTFNRQGLISQIHRILSKKDYPLQFFSLTLQLIHNIILMDFKKALPVITQLDYWTFLVELLDIESLVFIERQESRSLIKQMRGNFENENQYLMITDPCEYLDMAYMTINQILDLLFEAFKRDSQLAALLIKTTKLMDSIFQLIKNTFDQHRMDKNNNNENIKLKLRNRGLLTVFIDKIVKIIHVSMMHPQDYSVELISRFIFERPILSGKEQSRNWIYFIEMFQIIENYNQTFNVFDLKLALIRFISEFLVQTSHYKNNYLDELDQKISYQIVEGVAYSDFNESSSYGSMLLKEFQKVFNMFYIDDGQKQQADSENQKKDICLCIDILLSSCQSAKYNAVSLGLLNKIINICSDNSKALSVQYLNKYSGQVQSNIDKNRYKHNDQQLLQKFKYVKDISDLVQCESESLRMLSLIRNLFYDSDNLLVEQLFTQNQNIEQKNNQKAQTKQTKTKALFLSLNEKIVHLFAQIIDELGFQKQYENLVSETLLTIITFSSQNIRFKNCSLYPIDVSTQQKKVNVVKIICDFILKIINFQSTSRLIRLMYTFLRTLSISPDVVKEIMKNRFIEEIITKLIVQCKNSSDIKLFKIYICNFLEFLSGFTSTEEGQKQILKINQVFDYSIFVLENISLNLLQEQKVSVNDYQLTPQSKIIKQILLFIRNATLDSRQTKIYFLKNDDFLPSLMKFIQNEKVHPMIKAYSSAVLQTLVHNHQGMKAQINKSTLINDLHIMKSEYENLEMDNSYQTQNIYSYNFKKSGDEKIGVNIEYGHNYLIADQSHLLQLNNAMVKDMNKFILNAITGVLVLVQS